MAILGIDIDRKNPEYSKEKFLIYQPQFSKFLETDQGKELWDEFYEIANNTIFKSIYGSYWAYAMSLAIAHNIELVKMVSQYPSGENIGEITSGGNTGVLTSVGIGSFSKSWDLNYTATQSEEAMFWNQTPYGMRLMALLKTRPIQSIFVVTSGPIKPGNPSFRGRVNVFQGNSKIDLTTPGELPLNQDLDDR